MNIDTNEANANDPGGTRTELPVYSPKEALKHDLRNIDVPENATVFLSPNTEGLRDCFARVRIRTLEDVQLLGFIPRGLATEKLHSAIQADDEEARKLTYSSYSPSRETCHCDREQSP